MTNETGPVRKVIGLTAKPGQAQAMREALQALEIATRVEPGAVEFAFFQSLTDDHGFVLVEHFVDQAAFDLHLKADYTQAFFALDLVAGKRAIA